MGDRPKSTKVRSRLLLWTGLFWTGRVDDNKSHGERGETELLFAAWVLSPPLDQQAAESAGVGLQAAITAGYSYMGVIEIVYSI